MDQRITANMIISGIVSHRCQSQLVVLYRVFSFLCKVDVAVNTDETHKCDDHDAFGFSSESAHVACGDAASSGGNTTNEQVSISCSFVQDRSPEVKPEAVPISEAHVGAGSPAYGSGEVLLSADAHAIGHNDGKQINQEAATPPFQELRNGGKFSAIPRQRVPAIRGRRGR